VSGRCRAQACGYCASIGGSSAPAHRRGTSAARAALVAVALVAACSSNGSGGGGPGPGDDVAGAPGEGGPGSFDPCDWPMWGYGPDRTFHTDCASEITAATAPRLGLAWSFTTRDVVTATPAVAGGTVYVGDWSGRVYALALDTGDVRWTFDADVHPTVYSGQIVSSAAVAPDPGDSDRRLVLVGAGRTMYALDAASGEERWRHDVNPGGGPDDPSEIQSSPVAVGTRVLFGFDGHNAAGTHAGVKALDLATGEELWWFDPDQGAPPSGCAGVWSSPSVDAERGLVFFGTANCPTSPQGWGPYTEAIVAVDLATGQARWSYQPHPPNNDDFDFAGAPNLFRAGDADAVGLGNKDGHYYAVDRESGALLWDVEAAAVRVPSPNFSTGGFIGATAVAGDTIVGGTAVGGDCPCLHGIGTDGSVRWQQPAAGPTFAAAAAAGDVAFVGGTTDFTLRAVRVGDGEVVWSHPMPGAVAGGVAITRDAVVAVAGIREPGTEGVSQRSGVSVFRLMEGPAATTTTAAPTALPPTTAAPPPGEPPAVPGDDRRCVGAPCDLGFTLKEPPEGTAPSATLHVRPSPFRLEVRTDGLGPPEAWIRPGGEAARTGAVTYAVFMSVSDDNPTGALVCILDGDGDCVTEVLPDPLAESYNRVSILAIADDVRLPSPAEGFDRLVTTQDFTPPLVLG
jgi:polyvinyl alcohol dehydrogenase (cytochrome)